MQFVSINKQPLTINIEFLYYMVRVHELSVNDHLDGLKQKIDLIVEEIDSLRKERNGYKAKGK